MPDGNTLYFWFTPDPNIPAERQLNDGVTGIYVSCKDGGLWTTPNRVILNDPKQLALDGCEFVLDDTMWFCTTRAGYVGLHWFTAELISGAWTNWKVADFEPEYQVGELHRTGDGKELYFHSSRPGGYWEFDISVSTNADGHWQPPVNLEVVNTPNPDGWPFISADGSELWFTRIMGSPTIWRSVRTDGQWSRPQEIFAPFAAEASVDVYGSIYLAHHFFTESGMLEADIYVAHRRAD